MTLSFSLVLAAILLLAGPAVAGDDDENYEINWFLLLNYGARTGELSPGFGDGGDWLLGEERLRMDITAWSDSIEAEAKLKLDFFHDAINNEFDLDLREAYIDYSSGSFDFRFGRQVITWGVGDLVFINDVWPKDWVSFFAGRPLEYLKLGVDGVRIRWSNDILNAEFVYVPTFQGDNLPGPDRFSYFDPFISIPNRVIDEPETTFENGEVALRLYRNIAGFDVSGYFYKGYWHEPAPVLLQTFAPPTSISFFYPELNVYGASAQGAALGGILSLEFGYYASTEDPDGLDPAVKNSELRFLVGYSKQLMEDFTFGVQYFRKNFLDHDNYLLTLMPGMPISQNYRDEITVSLRRMMMRQTLTLALFAYYSPVEEDYYLIPSVHYKFSDQLSMTAGANFFGGAETDSFLGQFNENDNVYLSIRFDF